MSLRNKVKKKWEKAFFLTLKLIVARRSESSTCVFSIFLSSEKDQSDLGIIEYPLQDIIFRYSIKTRGEKLQLIFPEISPNLWDLLFYLEHSVAMVQP